MESRRLGHEQYTRAEMRCHRLASRIPRPNSAHCYLFKSPSTLTKLRYSLCCAKLRSNIHIASVYSIKNEQMLKRNYKNLLNLSETLTVSVPSGYLRKAFGQIVCTEKCTIRLKNLGKFSMTVGLWGFV